MAQFYGNEQRVFPILKYIADIETGRCPMGGEEL